MKIIVIGALRYSNFGDILFAKLFYTKLKNAYSEADILLYETPLNKVSAFCRRELGYRKKFKLLDLKNSDAAVYISGGYFSNKFESFIDKLLWHIRYALPGKIMMKRKKDIYVCGVGGGDFSWKSSAAAACAILNGAKFVSVRNIETSQKFNSIGVKNKIHIYPDTAQTITKHFKYERNCEDKIFLHLIPLKKYSALIAEKIFPALKKFLNDRPNIQLTVGYDALSGKKQAKYFDEAKTFFADRSIKIYKYNSIDEFCSFLSSCKAVITPKLHVGIVSCSFGRSVLSFPINYEKTKRYYNSINADERCADIYRVTAEEVYNMLVKYYDDPIVLPENTAVLAEKNFYAFTDIGRRRK